MNLGSPRPIAKGNAAADRLTANPTESGTKALGTSHGGVPVSPENPQRARPLPKQRDPHLHFFDPRRPLPSLGGHSYSALLFTFILRAFKPLRYVSLGHLDGNVNGVRRWDLLTQFVLNLKWDLPLTAFCIDLLTFPFILTDGVIRY